MSVETGSRPSRAPRTYEGYEDDRGRGWLAFGGALLLTVATLNIIDGIAAISNAHLYAASER